MTKKTKKNKQNTEKATPPDAVLRFTPYAWAKLQWFCHYGDTEIGGFGIADSDDLLLITDFQTVEQHVSIVTVSFDDEAVADFFDQQVDLGRRPAQFGRVWLHTHPGNSAHPSAVDEETFTRVFGSCDWAVMFILAKGGQTYARLRFNIGPGGESVIPAHLAWQHAFQESDHEAWEIEYHNNIHPEVSLPVQPGGNGSLSNSWPDRFELDDCDELELRLLAEERDWFEQLTEEVNE